MGVGVDFFCVVFRVNLTEREKTVFGQADINEGRLEVGLDRSDPALINVAFVLGPTLRFDVKTLHLAVFHQRQTTLLRLVGIDQQLTVSPADRGGFIARTVGACGFKSRFFLLGLALLAPFTHRTFSFWGGWFGRRFLVSR